MLRTCSIALLAGALIMAGATSARADSPKEFQKKWLENQNSWERVTLVKGLDPADEDSLETLSEFVLARQDWYYRDAAIDVLAGAYDPNLIAELEKLVDRGRNAMVAEGIVLAFGRSRNTDRVPFLVEQLEAKKWVVRRAAAIALAMVPDKRAIDPLITAFDEEYDKGQFMVWIHMLESMEKITFEKNMPKPRDWRSWWDTVKDTWTRPNPDKEIKAEDAKSGDVIRTKVRDVNLELRARGKGLPLLVLPEYGFEKDYLETYMRVLEEHNQILYLSLPGARDFPDLPPAPGMPTPFYPIKLIVEAFEELHAELIKNKVIENKPFAIMAHGMSCWIAMQYAADHPRSVRRMILISPNSGNKSWSEGRERTETTGQQRGDIEMEHYAMSQQYQNGSPRYSAQSDEERAALSRKGFTLYAYDTRDLELGRIYGGVVEKQVGENSVVRGPAVFRPMGGVTIPDFSLFKLRKSRTPTIVMFGMKSLRTSAADARAIAKHYATAKVIGFKGSSRLPFVEENEKFVTVVSKFLGIKR